MEYGLHKVLRGEKRNVVNFNDSRYENTQIKRNNTTLVQVEQVQSFSLYEPINDEGPIETIERLYNSAMTHPSFQEVVLKMLDIIQTFGEHSYQLFKFNNKYSYAKQYIAFIDTVFNSQVKQAASIVRVDRKLQMALQFNKELERIYGEKYKKRLDFTNRKTVNMMLEDVHETFKSIMPKVEELALNERKEEMANDEPGDGIKRLFEYAKGIVEGAEIKKKLVDNGSDYGNLFSVVAYMKNNMLVSVTNYPIGSQEYCGAIIEPEHGTIISSERGLMEAKAKNFITLACTRRECTDFKSEAVSMMMTNESMERDLEKLHVEHHYVSEEVLALDAAKDCLEIEYVTECIKYYLGKKSKDEYDLDKLRKEKEEEERRAAEEAERALAEEKRKAEEEAERAKTEQKAADERFADTMLQVPVSGTEGEADENEQNDSGFDMSETLLPDLDPLSQLSEDPLYKDLDEIKVETIKVDENTGADAETDDNSDGVTGKGEKQSAVEFVDDPKPEDKTDERDDGQSESIFEDYKVAEEKIKDADIDEETKKLNSMFG